MLKAILTYHEIEFPFTHRLTDLIDLGKGHDIILPKRLEDVCFLPPFAVEFWYDFYEEDGEPVDFEEVLTLLTELCKWVHTLIFPE